MKKMKVIVSRALTLLFFLTSTHILDHSINEEIGLVSSSTEHTSLSRIHRNELLSSSPLSSPSGISIGVNTSKKRSFDGT